MNLTLSPSVLRQDLSVLYEHIVANPTSAIYRNILFDFIEGNMVAYSWSGLTRCRAMINKSAIIDIRGKSLSFMVPADILDVFLNTVSENSTIEIEIGKSVELRYSHTRAKYVIESRLSIEDFEKLEIPPYQQGYALTLKEAEVIRILDCLSTFTDTEFMNRGVKGMLVNPVDSQTIEFVSHDGLNTAILRLPALSSFITGKIIPSYFIQQIRRHLSYKSELNCSFIFTDRSVFFTCSRFSSSANLILHQSISYQNMWHVNPGWILQGTDRLGLLTSIARLSMINERIDFHVEDNQLTLRARYKGDYAVEQHTVEYSGLPQKMSILAKSLSKALSIVSVTSDHEHFLISLYGANKPMCIHGAEGFKILMNSTSILDAVHVLN